MRWLWVFTLALLPVSEIRGAMTYGLKNEMNIFGVYFLSVVGNMLPAILIFWLFRPIISWANGTKIFGGIARWLESRTARKADVLMKSSALALFLFVAVPFPTTGAWTGSMIAAILNMRFKYALPTIFFGVCVSGLATMLVVKGIFSFCSVNNL